MGKCIADTFFTIGISIFQNNFRYHFFWNDYIGNTLKSNIWNILNNILELNNQYTSIIIEIYNS